MTKVIGVMALEGAALSKLVDNTVTALRAVNPTWVQVFDPDFLPSHVQSIILEGAASAREQVKLGESKGLFETGCIRVEFDPEGDGFTSVLVLIDTVWDFPEPDDA